MEVSSWNDLISQLHAPHLLQTAQWAEFKRAYGWQPRYLVWQEDAGGWKLFESASGEFPGVVPAAAGLLLQRKPFPGLSVLYLPKGPLLRDPGNLPLWERILEDLERLARQHKALQLKIDPDVEIGRGVPGEEDARDLPAGLALRDLLVRRGWLFSEEQIQFRNTVLLDLQVEEEEILARMKSKTRYNIRLSSRKGIQVRRGSQADLGILYRMYADTAARAGFTIREEAYYQALWQAFLTSGSREDGLPEALPLVAEFEGQPVAGAVIFRFCGRAWYLHGMSLPEHSDKMATHLIQWEAIRWARQQGSLVYDMWGAPDEFHPGDSLWGVYRFKSGYGGQVSRTLGAWDFPANRLLYTLYSRWLPRALDVLRWFRDRQTRRLASQAPGG